MRRLLEGADAKSIVQSYIDLQGNFLSHGVEPFLIVDGLHADHLARHRHFQTAKFLDCCIAIALLLGYNQ